MTPRVYRRELAGAVVALLVADRVPFASAQGGETAIDVLQRARLLVEQGDASGALIRLKDWLRRNPKASALNLARVRLGAAWVAADAEIPDEARLQLGALQRLLPAFRTALIESGQLRRQMARVADRIGDLITAERLLVPAEKELERDPPAAAEAANALGMTRLELLRPNEAVADFQRSLATLARADFQQGEPVVAALVNLANACLELGELRRAVEAVARAREAAGVDNALHRAAAYAEAQTKLKEPDLVGAQTILEQLAVAPDDDPVRAHALLLLATVQFNRGLMPEAERGAVAAADAYRAAFGEFSPAFAKALHLLGTTHDRLQDPTGAASFLKRAADIRRRLFGPGSVQLHTTEIERAWLDVQAGQLAEAEIRARGALDAFRKAPPPLQRRFEGLAHVLLGLTAEMRGQASGAAAEFRAAQGLIEASEGENSPDLGFSLVRLGRLLTREGRYSEAELPLDRAIALYGRLGPGSTARLAEALAARAELRERQGDRHGALENSRQGYAALRARWSLNADDAGAGGIFERNSVRNLFSAHARLLLRLEEGPPGANEEAFAATQDALNSRVGDVLRRAATRAATVDGPLGRLLHSREEAADALRQVEVLQRDALSRGPVTPLEAERLRGLQVQWLTRLRGIDAVLAESFHSFAEFARPQPTSLERLQAVLDPQETLILSSSGPDEFLIWAIARDRVDTATVSVAERTLADLVRRLRVAVDLEFVPGDPPPFVFDVARQLYKHVLKPILPHLEQRQSLVFALDGVLQTIPPYLMFGGEPADWLIRKFAVAITPSPSAFVTGRETYKASRALNAFLGVGDPRFSAFRRPAPAGLHGPPPELRMALASLNPLHDTSDELSKMAAMFPGGRTSLVLDQAASKSGIFSEVPETYRVLVFATHAVMPEQLPVPGLTEPAIILTPDGHSDWDGLLIASEISAMQLDADLVILSACNTAAPEQGTLADNFSGLVRAFLHAGARAILVSHWAVESASTVRLTTQFIAELQADPRMRKGEALRRSMLQMIDSGDHHFQHPAFWAPFVIVGD